MYINNQGSQSQVRFFSHPKMTEILPMLQANFVPGCDKFILKSAALATLIPCPTSPSVQTIKLKAWEETGSLHHYVESLES